MKKLRDISPRWFALAAAGYTVALLIVIVVLQLLLTFGVRPQLAEFYAGRTLPFMTRHYGIPVLGGMTVGGEWIPTGPATWAVWGLMYGLPLAALPFALLARGPDSSRRRWMFFSGHFAHSILYKILLVATILSLASPFWS